MSRFGLSEKDITYIREAIKKFPEVKEILIFGSRAMGNFKPGSDVDICIKGEKITFTIISKIKALLQDEGPLPYQFDLVAYHLIESQELRDHIDTHGKSLFDE